LDFRFPVHEGKKFGANLTSFGVSKESFLAYMVTFKDGFENAYQFLSLKYIEFFIISINIHQDFFQLGAGDIVYLLVGGLGDQVGNDDAISSG
jgi:hypothetical protein